MPWRARGFVHCCLRRRASRPQLKRDPLGGKLDVDRLARALLRVVASILAVASCGQRKSADRPTLDTTMALTRPTSDSGARTPGAGRDTTLFRVTPGQRFGAVTATVSHVDLVQLFGKANVHLGRVQCAEGSCNEPGTVVKVPGCPDTLEVFWIDTVALSTPATVTAALRFDQYGDSSLHGCWRTQQGLGIGTPLQDLEALNQGPFQLDPLGEWDYAGGVGPWLGGRLGTLLQPASGPWIGLRVDFLSSGTLSPPEFQQVSKPQRDSLRSDEPLVRRLNPRVVQFWMTFERKP